MKHLSYLNYLLLSLMAIFFIGCGDSTGLDGSIVTNTKPVQLAADEIKFIARHITNPQDEASIVAEEYDINPNSKLLVRLSSLKKSAGSILEEQPILFRLVVKEDRDQVAQQELELCPIMTNWMMYATWSRPGYNSKTKWKAAGGDVDSSSCMKALSKTDPKLQQKEEAAFCSGTKTLCYDVQPYMTAFIRSRKIDYGLAVMSANKSVLIYGDGTMKGPELFWRKLKW